MQKPECWQEVSVGNEWSHALSEGTVSAIPSPLDELDSAMAPFFPSARGEPSPYDEPALSVDIAEKGKLVMQPQMQIARQQNPIRVRKYGGSIGSVGSVLALIAFFLPWFILQTACGGEVTVTPANNFTLLPFLYLLATFSCLSIGIMVFTNRDVRIGCGMKLTYFFSSLGGLITVWLMSIFQPGVIKAVLAGFWIALTGFLLTVLGSIVTFFDHQ